MAKNQPLVMSLRILNDFLLHQNNQVNLFISNISWKDRIYFLSKIRFYKDQIYFKDIALEFLKVNGFEPVIS